MNFSVLANRKRSTEAAPGKNGDLKYMAFNMRRFLSILFVNQLITTPQPLESGSNNQVLRFYRSNELHEIIVDPGGYVWKFSNERSGITSQRFRNEGATELIGEIANHFEVPDHQLKKSLEEFQREPH